ncbi:[FeFe]-hydrogenase, mitochondrial [Pelomyxa schiedti]|nr:[FeFe]-hydrogenase, mitochondrial [Pelomyxa schiedti]
MALVGSLWRSVVPVPRAFFVNQRGYHSGIDRSARAVSIDWSKCIGCRKCERVCTSHQGLNVLALMGSPKGPRMSVKGNVPLVESDCISCGQCTIACKTGAITECDDVPNAIRALQDPDLVTVIQISPSARVSVAECFKSAQSKGNQVHKVVGACRKAGFQYVIDTGFAADLTVIEESTELMKRIERGGPFPMFTSCCSSWVTLIEKKYPEFSDNLSQCKSPMSMMGAIVKTYFAAQHKIDPKKIFHISLMPCLSKKEEIHKSTLLRDGKRDVDLVLTTREFGRLLNALSIDWDTVPSSDFDDPLGYSSGAAALFSVPGGVAEAVCRNLNSSHALLPKLTFTSGDTDSVRIAKFPLPQGPTINIASIHGSSNAQKFLHNLKLNSNTKDTMHLVEVMACVGGCVGGGGQPQATSPTTLDNRSSALCSIDTTSTQRNPRGNQLVQHLYSHFLGSPGSALAHILLHTKHNH